MCIVILIFISVFATTIELTPSHTGLIAENVDITLTCVTDESNPTADIVWNRDGEIVSSGISESEVSGQYNVKKRRSVITLTTEKNLNGVQYKCQVEGQDDVSDQTVVQVKCEKLQFIHFNVQCYPLYFIGFVSYCIHVFNTQCNIAITTALHLTHMTVQVQPKHQ